MANLAVDTFVRPNQSGWGTASDGANTWSGPLNTALSTASISSNEGVLSAGNGADSQMICGSHGSTTDINMLIRTSTSSTGNLNGLLWRYLSINNGSGYRCGFFGGTTFNIDKYTNGARANIGSFAFVYVAGSFYWIRLVHVSGGTLQIRVWADGGSEPSLWNLTQVETTYASGNFGCSVFLAANTTCSFDSLTVTDNSGGPSSTVPTLVVPATFRSGEVQGAYRSGAQPVAYRDGQVKAGGR